MADGGRTGRGRGSGRWDVDIDWHVSQQTMKRRSADTLRVRIYTYTVVTERKSCTTRCGDGNVTDRGGTRRTTRRRSVLKQLNVVGLFGVDLRVRRESQLACSY